MQERQIASIWKLHALDADRRNCDEDYVAEIVMLEDESGLALRATNKRTGVVAEFDFLKGFRQVQREGFKFMPGPISCIDVDKFYEVATNGLVRPLDA